MNTKKATMLVVRTTLLVLAVFLVLGGPLPIWAGRILPLLSPLEAFANAIGQRTWYASLFWLAPPLFFLLLAFAKGRFFCNWICPVGTLCAYAKSITFKKRILHNRISGYIFWTIMGSSIVGFPAFLFLDPLSTASRTFIVFDGAYYAAAIIPGLILPAIIIFGLFQPMIWCSHVCPLGYLNALMERLRKHPRETFNRERRTAMIGLGLGIPLGFLLPKLGIGKEPPILPPGALDPENFANVCTRCGACVKACPTGILRFKLTSDQGLAQICQPEMDANEGACSEFCRDCMQVCPSGAIGEMGEEEKRNCQIGIAEVNRKACIAWHDGEHCMVCDEFCPYRAIDTRYKVFKQETPEGEKEDVEVPCPIVDRDKCRGCGFCQYNCPAIRMGKAITVRGVPEQKQLNPEI